MEDTKMLVREISAYAIPGLPQNPYSAAILSVYNVFKVTEEDLKIKTRSKEICYPRQVCITMLLISGNSLTYSARQFDKDHATALHAKKIVSNVIETKYPHKDYENTIDALSKFKSYYPSADLSKLPGDWK